MVAPSVVFVAPADAPEPAPRRRRRATKATAQDGAVDDAAAVAPAEQPAVALEAAEAVIDGARRGSRDCRRGGDRRPAAAAPRPTGSWASRRRREHGGRRSGGRHTGERDRRPVTTARPTRTPSRRILPKPDTSTSSPRRRRRRRRSADSARRSRRSIGRRSARHGRPRAREAGRATPRTRAATGCEASGDRLAWRPSASVGGRGGIRGAAALHPHRGRVPGPPRSGRSDHGCP